MESFNLSDSTGSSQSQQTGSFQSQQTGSSQNQQPRRQRKRGIAALLADITNEQPQCSQRVCKQVAKSRVTVSVAPTFDLRGDPVKGVKEKARQASKVTSNDTLYRVYTNDRELFNKGQQLINNYVSKNVSFEIQKALSIQLMTTAMTELEKGIVEASKFAATVTGFSSEVVRRWTFAYFSNLAQYPGSIDDIDHEYMEMELSSERGRGCGNPTAILHDEEFMLTAREYIHSNAYRKGEPNLTTEMFHRWVNNNYGVSIAAETARRWLHHLGFSMCDHQKGVYFDGHERDDVVRYRTDFLDKLSKLDETTITPSQPSPCVEEGEKRYIRIAHDESTFYSNADQE